MLRQRNTSSEIRFARAVVDEMNGLILLPDNWNASVYTLNNTNVTYSEYTSNIISAEQWNTLEMKGAVFLPNAGRRYETTVAASNVLGFYWSSTTRGDGNIYIFKQLWDYLSDTDVEANYIGCSVRLVQDYNP